MPRVMTDDDLKNLRKKGRYVKGQDGRTVNPWQPEPKPEPPPQDKQAKALQALADAAVEAVQKAAKTQEISAGLVQVILAKLRQPEPKAEPQARKLKVTVTKYNAEGRIKEFEIERVD